MQTGSTLLLVESKTRAEERNAMSVQNDEHEDREDQRVGPADRRKSESNQWWHDPRFYIALIALIVTLGGSAWTIARNIAITGNQVSEMRAQLLTISTTMQTFTNELARKDEKINVLEQKVRSLEVQLVDIQKSQNDYNYNLSTRLARLEK